MRSLLRSTANQCEPLFVRVFATRQANAEQTASSFTQLSILSA